MWHIEFYVWYLKPFSDIAHGPGPIIELCHCCLDYILTTNSVRQTVLLRKVILKISTQLKLANKQEILASHIFIYLICKSMYHHEITQMGLLHCNYVQPSECFSSSVIYILQDFILFYFKLTLFVESYKWIPIQVTGSKSWIMSVETRVRYITIQVSIQVSKSEHFCRTQDKFRKLSAEQSKDKKSFRGLERVLNPESLSILKALESSYS